MLLSRKFREFYSYGNAQRFLGPEYRLVLKDGRATYGLIAFQMFDKIEQITKGSWGNIIKAIRHEEAYKGYTTNIIYATGNVQIYVEERSYTIIVRKETHRLGYVATDRFEYTNVSV